jgi:hypothetical protein
MIYCQTLEQARAAILECDRVIAEKELLKKEYREWIRVYKQAASSAAQEKKVEKESRKKRDSLRESLRKLEA